MKILHLLVSGGFGGIEVLMKHYAQHSRHENHFAFLWDGGVMANRIAEQGHRVTVLDYRREGPVSTLQQIDRLTRKEKFDAVVTHHRAPFLKLAMLWLKWRNPQMRTVTYAHSAAGDICEEHRAKGLWLRRRIHRTGFRQADSVVAISEFVKNSLISGLNIPEEKITVIYNGVPIPKKPPVPRQNPAPQLIYVGRLAKEKGVDHILRALAALPPDLDYHFDIVGSGPEETELQKMAEEYGLTHRVRFLGFREDAGTLLAGADFFVHAPRWEEGFCLSAVEAMGNGCVCICTDRGAMRELIVPGVNGFLVNDAAALPQILEEALRTKNLADLRVAARARGACFCVERFASALDTLLEGNPV